MSRDTASPNKNRPWLPKTTRVSVVAMSYRRAAVGGRGDGVAALLASNFPGRRKFLRGAFTSDNGGSRISTSNGDGGNNHGGSNRLA